MEELTISAVFNTTAKNLYDAWLDSEKHSDFTGSFAEIKPEVGGEFTAWDGYIWGKTVELNPFYRILQSWRTTEFPESSPDSMLEIKFEDTPLGGKVSIIHSQIPKGQSASYLQGWKDYYFAPMQDYFC